MNTTSHVAPKHYRIHLEPDLRNFRFLGRTEILLETTEPVQEITLNALELAIWRCTLGRLDQTTDCSFAVDPQREQVTAFLPQVMNGEFTLTFEYMGKINDRMAGFYRSTYRENEQEKLIAVTQFEESEARRAFPCFDHPERKSRFQIEMVVEGDATAISNLPVKEDLPWEKGKRLLVFDWTPRMSTYLLFFGTGDFEFLEDPGDVLARVVTTPGMTRYGDFGLQFGRKSLEYCEEYYGIPFPLPKLDLIAIPDFAFGAMENWGAITFRENLLLHYPDITSKAGEERICEVIAHEMVHQWFGNLVSPADWKYLWLNESFATYFAYGVVDHYHPEWDVWEQFLYSQMNTALARDALQETFPIEIPGGEHVVINTATAPIIYNKGGSILLQIRSHIGSQDFRKGLQHYLNKYKYGCASSEDLWESFEAASEQPITRIMKSWIEQPGYPVVEVKREGNRLLMNQERFSYLPLQWDQEWIIPMTVSVFRKDGTSQVLPHLFQGRSTSLDISSDTAAYKVNDGQSGFFRVRYMDESNLKQLATLISEKSLPPEDRWGLQNDLFALTLSGHVSIDAYLGFLSAYSQEHDFLPLMSIRDNLLHAYLILEGEVRSRIAAVGKTLLESALGHMGYEPDVQEKHTTSMLRDQILAHAVMYGSSRALEFAVSKFQVLVKGGPVHPDLLKTVMQVGAWNGDGTTFDWLVGRLESSDSEHERMNILRAMADFQDSHVVDRVLDYTLQKVPLRNKFITLVAMAGNPHAIPRLWDWYTSRLEEVEQLHPLHYERVIAAFVPVCGLGREDAVRDFFEAYMENASRATDAIKLSLERLEINSRMRRREGREETV